MSARSPLACRAFEERLMARLDVDSGPFPVDAHAAECPFCAALVEEVLSHSALFARLKRPEAPQLLARLAAPPSDFAARRAGLPVLELLQPGALKTPEPSGELMGRLFFLPTRARRAPAQETAPKGVLGAFFAFFSDWRITVAAAYAVLLLAVTLMKVDPMSVARDAASGIGAAGEKAIAEAKATASSRIASSGLVQAAAPLTTRMEYRIYRTVAAAKARASAYSQLVIERVFGATLEASHDGEPSSDAREPRERSLRS